VMKNKNNVTGKLFGYVNQYSPSRKCFSSAPFALLPTPLFTFPADHRCKKLLKHPQAS